MSLDGGLGFVMGSLGNSPPARGVDHQPDMVMDMNPAQVRTVEQARQVLEQTQSLEFRAVVLDKPLAAHPARDLGVAVAAQPHSHRAAMRTQQLPIVFKRGSSRGERLTARRRCVGAPVRAFDPRRGIPKTRRPIHCPRLQRIDPLCIAYLRPLQAHI